MKKKIALFLAAALLSVGLIVSCGGGGDDDGDGDGPGTNPNPGATKYTITFNLNGGESADDPVVSTITVDANTAVGATKWPGDPSKTIYTFKGWFDGSTEYTATTKITKNVTVKAEYYWPTPLLDKEGIEPLGEFDWMNETKKPTQRGWTFGAEYNNYNFTDDTWLLLETTRGNMSGFGGLQLTFINDYSYEGGEKKYEKDLKGGWDGYNKGEDEIIYFAINLSAHDKYADFMSEVASDFFRLYIASYPWANLGFLNAYLVEENLNKIRTDDNWILDLASGGTTYGFIVSAKDDGIDWDALFDDTFVPVESLDYTGEVRGFTTTQIALDAKINPSSASKSKIVWSTTTAGATISGNKLTATTAGTVTVTAKISRGGEDGADYTQTFTDQIDVITIPATTGGAKTIFVGKSTNNDNKTIGFGGYDGTLDYDLFKGNAYLVCAFWDSPTDKDGQPGVPNKDGFGGIQVVVQYPKSNGSYPWLQSESAGWTSFNNSAGGLVYLVVPIKNLKDYDTVEESATKAKLVLNYGFKRYLGSWITTVTLNTSSMTNHTKQKEDNGGDTDNDGKFFITKTPGF